MRGAIELGAFIGIGAVAIGCGGASPPTHSPPPDGPAAAERHADGSDEGAPHEADARQLSREDIQSVIRAAQPQIRYCYEKQLVRDPQLEGMLRLEISISPDGDVTQVTPASSSLDSDEVVECVVGLARAWTFPGAGGATEVAYPFIFSADSGDAQAEYWSHLEALCGKAFEGELVEGTEEGDRPLADERLVMVAHTCEENELRIGFHAGDDRSRTWVVRRDEEGLGLAHDHRDPDGTPHEVTGYGGRTQGDGTATAQEFYADDHTAEVAPEAATNIWTMRIEPGERFVYELRRQVGERRFRADFDLTRPVEPPASK
jgi:hypothetical protein